MALTYVQLQNFLEWVIHAHAATHGMHTIAGSADCGEIWKLSWRKKDPESQEVTWRFSSASCSALQCSAGTVWVWIEVCISRYTVCLYFSAATLTQSRRNGAEGRGFEVVGSAMQD